MKMQLHAEREEVSHRTGKAQSKLVCTACCILLVASISGMTVICMWKREGVTPCVNDTSR